MTDIVPSHTGLYRIIIIIVIIIIITVIILIIIIIIIIIISSSSSSSSSSSDNNYADNYADSSSSSVAGGDADNSSSSVAVAGGDESDNGGITTDPVANLLGFSPVANPTFMWGSLSADVFTSTLDSIYSKVVHWRRNTFVVPYGKAGSSFVSELSRLFSAFASASALESVAMKVASVFQF